MASNTHTALRLLVTAAAAAAAALVTTAAAQDVTDQGGPEWSYAGDATGPDNWANLDPRYEACGGDRQSPIDLAPTSVTGVSSLSRVVNLLPSRFVVNEDKRNSVHYECDFGRCGNTEWGGIDYTVREETGGGGRVGSAIMNQGVGPPVVRRARECSEEAPGAGHGKRN